MAICFSEVQRFLALKLEDVPVCERGLVLVDLWAKLSRSEKFIRVLPKGEVLSEATRSKFLRHSDPLVYALSEEFELHASAHTKTAKLTDRTQFFKRQDSTSQFAEVCEVLGRSNARSLGRPLDEQLRKIYAKMTSDASGVVDLNSIEKIATQLLEIVAPEVNEIRRKLGRNPEFVGALSDSASLCAITLYFSMATGQSAPSVFRDYAYACLLMDMPLFEFSKKDLETHLLNPESLSEDLREAIEKHPTRSLELCDRLYPRLPANIRRLIEGHHELFNGRGYPARVRSELSAPIVKVLALAVDVFDQMKIAYLRREALSLEQALDKVAFGNQPAHLRRHNLGLCREIRSVMSATIVAA